MKTSMVGVKEGEACAWERRVILRRKGCGTKLPHPLRVSEPRPLSLSASLGEHESVGRVGGPKTRRSERALGAARCAMKGLNGRVRRDDVGASGPPARTLHITW